MYEIRISIADICVALCVDDANMAERIRARYAEFLAPNAPADLAIEVAVREGVQFVPMRPGPWVINTTFQNEVLTFESYVEKGAVNLATGEGHLVMAPTGLIEYFLRALYAWCTLRAGGLLLHSAGVVKDGRAFLFFGVSGSGKTTATRLSDGHIILSDDILIVKPVNGSFQAFGVPFRSGEMQDTPQTNIRAPLAGLYRLRKAPEHRLAPMPLARAVAELASCARPVAINPDLGRQVVDICVRLATQVPVFELYFRKDPDFWRVIDDHR
ncbi:MAG: hypothetical protein RML36_03615 [Anaerolineae bacterium]|nr:hypothetical protein [Anaerolineae bacterium]MDW8098557.1 hypothetical protein [Anaerolineae bacterium]